MYAIINSLQRQFLARFMSGLYPLYIVNEYPKSGGSWFSQMLSEAIEVPFPRNRLPVWRSSILQGHYLYKFGMKNVVILWRDGRDVMVSWYYHCLFHNDLNDRKLVDRVRGELGFCDYHDIANNLPEFIDYSFTGQKHPNFSWTHFVDKWVDAPDVTHTKYENLRVNAVTELMRITHELTGKEISASVANDIVDKYSFINQSGREIGGENINSFMRKGVVGDWRNKFSRDACEIFDFFAGESLMKLGYEVDHSWVAAKLPTMPRSTDL